MYIQRPQWTLQMKRFARPGLSLGNFCSLAEKLQRNRAEQKRCGEGSKRNQREPHAEHSFTS
jgi:hypothetical protein